MAIAMVAETLNSTLLLSAQILTAKPPTIVAPRVLAIVLRLRIAEVVSSRPSL